MVWTSLFGIITLILLARALGFAASPSLADAAEAQRIAADALPGFDATEAAVAQGGTGALVAGRDGRVALVRPFGDRWVVRIVNGAATTLNGGRLHIKPDEALFPATDLDLGSAAATWRAGCDLPRSGPDGDPGIHRRDHRRNAGGAQQRARRL